MILIPTNPDLAACRKIGRYVKRWGIRKRGTSPAAWNDLTDPQLCILSIAREIHLATPFSGIPSWCTAGTVDFIRATPYLGPAVATPDDLPEIVRNGSGVVPPVTWQRSLWLNWSLLAILNGDDCGVLDITVHSPNVGGYTIDVDHWGAFRPWTGWRVPFGSVPNVMWGESEAPIEAQHIYTDAVNDTKPALTWSSLAAAIRAGDVPFLSDGPPSADVDGEAGPPRL